MEGVTKVASETQADEAAATAAPEKGPFVSAAKWTDGEPDCLVICCSDHRFEQQTRDLARHLGFSAPHVIQLPSGPALTLPLVSSFGFLSKAADKILEMTAEMKHAKTVICVAHSGCGAYKAIGENRLLSVAVRRITGHSIRDLQREHLVKAARRIKSVTKAATVRAFFADVVGADGDEKKVKFTEIP